MKTNTNQVRKKVSTARTSPQVKTKTPAAPGEFKIIRMRDCPMDSPKIDTPAEVVDFWRKHVVTAPWFKDDKECMCVFMLNVRHRLLGFELVSQGTSDMILMNPREVLRPAAVHNAAAIIIAHNHPSGEPSPSEGDIKATRVLILAAEHLKIGFLDHIIIGDARRKNSFASLRGLGYFVDDDPALRSIKPAAENKDAGWTDLEFAVTETHGLLQLMADKFEHLAKLDGCDFSGPKADYFCSAVGLMVMAAQKKLRDAFDETFHAVYAPEAKEVAS